MVKMSAPSGAAGRCKVNALSQGPRGDDNRKNGSVRRGKEAPVKFSKKVI